MLSALSIRDVVLIDRLDLAFGPGLTVLTGETGAGKSILLDSLGLALGARAEAALVRRGAAQASVAAVFQPASGHPAYALLREQGIEAEDEIVLRRVVGADGRSRAFANDQPVGAALLRRAGAMLIETQGQGEQAGLADPSTHRPVLDAFGVPSRLRAETASRHAAWRDAVTALAEAREAIATAERDREWLAFAVDELATLAPEADEEERLAAERHALLQGERRAEAVAAALAELVPGGGRDRRQAPASALRGAVRALHRLAGPGETENPAAPVLAAIERAEEALAEAETLLTRLADEQAVDPRRLERAEERLFALRAAARKHNVTVDELAPLLAGFRDRLDAIETGAGRVAALAAAAEAAHRGVATANAALSEARRAAASRLERAVGRELPALRLERARFVVEVAPLPETAWSPEGADGVRFLIAANPGEAPAPLGRVASGGELARLMLALKVVLAAASPAGTLVFDEVDSGVGGATAAAVGERLARVAEHVQVLVVTHSPQVAARGGAQFRVRKQLADGRAETRVEALDDRARREEIARMLAGERVTDAARAAADDLLGAA